MLVFIVKQPLETTETTGKYDISSTSSVVVPPARLVHAAMVLHALCVSTTRLTGPHCTLLDS